MLMITLAGLSLSGRSAHASEWDLNPEEMIWVGPHLNFIFGHQELEVSLGLEGSYWFTSQDDLPLAGACLGLEYNFKRAQILGYAQGQLSFLFGGGSFGAIYEPERGLGVQGSLWANFGLGGIFHYRYFSSELPSDKVAGVYLKLPVWERD